MPAFAPAQPTSENQLQAAVVKWARAHADRRLRLLFHVPNGGARSGQAGGVMVAIGARSGVPDLFLPVPVTAQTNGMARLVPGLWLEMKWGAGDCSEPQKRWLRTLAGEGYDIALAWSEEEAQQALLDYLNGHGQQHTDDALAHIGPGPLVP